MADVRTQLRALEVFQVFARVRKPLRLSELARELNIPVSSCFAIVRALLDNGYLYEMARRGGYYPTGRIHSHSTAITAHDPLRELIGDVLARLRDETGETAGLGRRAGANSVYTAVFESPSDLRLAALKGALRPLYSNAMGKALLSELPPAVRRQIFEGTGMPRVTDKTIVSPEKLDTEIARMKKRGWFSSEGESMHGAMGIAVPLRLGMQGYALHVGGPAERMRTRLAQHVEALLRARDDIHELAGTGH